MEFQISVPLARRKSRVKLNQKRYTLWQTGEKEERYTKAIRKFWSAHATFARIFSLTLFYLSSNDAEFEVHGHSRSCHRKLSSRKEASNFIQEYQAIRELVESDSYVKMILMTEKLNLLPDPSRKVSSSDAVEKRLKGSYCIAAAQ